MDIVMEREGGVKQDRVWERERSGREVAEESVSAGVRLRGLSLAHRPEWPQGKAAHVHPRLSHGPLRGQPGVIGGQPHSAS